VIGVKHIPVISIKGKVELIGMACEKDESFVERSTLGD